MKSEKKNFSVRIDGRLLEKLRYIAKSEERSVNKKVILLIRDFVAEYEKVNGEIKLFDECSDDNKWRII